MTTKRSTALIAAAAAAASIALLSPAAYGTPGHFAKGSARVAAPAAPSSATGEQEPIVLLLNTPPARSAGAQG
ncbi:hypothetical protein ACQB60_35325 [Actinomycetota bacterium Odt1-20B]